MRRFLLLVVALVAGCSSPNHSPATVRAADLARFYRDNPDTARDAYGGKAVLLSLTNPVRRGNELHWHLSDPNIPAVVVCQFAGEPPPVAHRVYITGTCRGRVDDPFTREFPGYTFHVLITDCRPAAPPAP